MIAETNVEWLIVEWISDDKLIDDERWVDGNHVIFLNYMDWSCNIC